MKTLRRFLQDERGIESAEWALILGIIVLTAVVAATGAKDSMKTIFGNLKTELGNAAK
jgi:Flp pilus assembly pilin Flp